MNYVKNFNSLVKNVDMTLYAVQIPGVSASVPFNALWANEGNPARVASLCLFKIKASNSLT